MKISAPIIAIIMAASSSVATAKPRHQSDDSDPVCVFKRVALADLFANEAICFINRLMPFTTSTESDSGEDVFNPLVAALDNERIIIFERFFANPFFMVTDSDSGPAGNDDGSIQYSELVDHFRQVLEPHDCEQVDALAIRVRDLRVLEGVGMIDFAGSGVH